jgi:2-aminoethylphosphonate-pyruvate transaminase
MQIEENMSPTFTSTDWKDKALFTPGPLTTSRTVKQAMLRDLGSRDTEFIEIVRSIRLRLVQLAGVREPEYTTVLMQGSGTFGVEAVLSSTLPPDGKLLVLVNGAYGQRMVKMASMLKIPVIALTGREDLVPDLDQLEDLLAQENQVHMVAAVHCETTTGILNPIDEIGQIVKKYRRVYFVDAMSSFAAYPINMQALGIDYLVSSANKCIEGVPGFSYAICRRAALEATRGWARSLSLDLLAQLEGLERDGQFRFTPPTHALLAFNQALLELEQEGGISGRAARYQRNYTATLRGMQELGFQPYLDASHRGCIITTFRYPDHSNFDFRRFYELLSEKDCVIYPGKLTHADCFRIGHVGRLNLPDVQHLLMAVRQTLAEMQIELKPIPME